MRTPAVAVEVHKNNVTCSDHRVYGMPFCTLSLLLSDVNTATRGGCGATRKLFVKINYLYFSYWMCWLIFCFVLFEWPLLHTPFDIVLRSLAVRALGFCFFFLLLSIANWAYANFISSKMIDWPADPGDFVITHQWRNEVCETRWWEYDARKVKSKWKRIAIRETYISLGICVCYVCCYGDS